MTYETTLRRRQDKSLVAETEVHLFGKRWLRLTTSKGQHGLKCTASVCTVDKERGTVTHCIGFGTPGGDFWRTVDTMPGVRCTEKNLRTLHERGLERIGDVIAMAKAHYAARGEETA
jgi:hypothetical protein